MLALAVLSAARLASLATGRGGLPSGDEWPLVLVAFAALSVLALHLLRTAGLTLVEAATVAVGAPMLVLVDVPLGDLSPALALSANVAGCLVPLGIALKVLVSHRRLPVLESIIVVGVAILVCFASSHVVVTRGVLLQYRVPMLVIGALSAALFHQSPQRAGAVAFAAGAIGVLVGADVLHLRELVTSGGSGRIILGGAGLLDGILLVSILAAFVAMSVSTLARFVLQKARAPARGAA